MAAFDLQRPSWIVNTDTVWPTKLKTFTVWPFTERLFWFLFWSISGPLNGTRNPRYGLTFGMDTSQGVPSWDPCVCLVQAQNLHVSAAMTWHWLHESLWSAGVSSALLHSLLLRPVAKTRALALEFCRTCIHLGSFFLCSLCPNFLPNRDYFEP